MNNTSVNQKIHNNLVWDYLESQAFGYVLLSIIFLTRYSDKVVLVIISWGFIAVSIACLLSPICATTRDLALRFDKWFQGGLFVGSVAIVMIDGWVGALTKSNSPLFWILVSWLFILVLKDGFRISKRLGVYKTVVFGSGALGLFMIFLGFRTALWEIIAVLGIVLSIPALDDLLYKRYFK